MVFCFQYETTTDTKMGYKQKGVWIFYVNIISALILIKWLPARLNDYQLGIMVIFCGEYDIYIYPIQSLPLPLMTWWCKEQGPISPVAPFTSMD